MATINLTFTSNPELAGAMVNDAVYYIDSSVSAADMNDVIHIGSISAFTTSGTSFVIQVDTGSLNFTMPTQNDYVFFSKNNEINMSAVLGYYAEAKFVNDSTEQAELFAVATEILESSK